LTPKELPQFVRDMLASPPRRGQGLNLWFFRVTRVLHAFRSPGDIIELLRAATHGEPLQHNEIERAVERSKALAWRPGGPPVEHRPAHPKLEPERRARVIAQEACTLSQLIAASPEQFSADGEPQTERVIDAMFPDSPLLCVASNRWNAATRPRKTWGGHLARLPYMVPNPMRAKIGINQDGERSERCLDNVGPRRYLVIDQDQGYGTEDEQVAVIKHLARCLRLVLVMHSGGKSLHAWFAAAGVPEERIDQFFNLACHLGADPQMLVPCQLARIPDGRRENGNRQRLIFFDPEAVPSVSTTRQESAQEPELEPENVPGPVAVPEVTGPQEAKDPAVSEADLAEARRTAGELTAPAKSADLTRPLWNDGIVSAVMKAFGATSATLTAPKGAELPPRNPPPGIFVPGKPYIPSQAQRVRVPPGLTTAQRDAWLERDLEEAIGAEFIDRPESIWTPTL
jgi:hypothetical protein